MSQNPQKSNKDSIEAAEDSIVQSINSEGEARSPFIFAA